MTNCQLCRFSLKVGPQVPFATLLIRATLSKGGNRESREIYPPSFCKKKNEVAEVEEVVEEGEGRRLGEEGSKIDDGHWGWRL